MSTTLAKPEIVEGHLAPTIQPLSPEYLISKAIDKGLTLDMLERLLEMRRHLQAEQDAVVARQAKLAYDQALSEFQRECPVIAKRKSVLNKDGKSVRYRYAPLGDIVEQVKELLGKHGFSHKIGEAFLDRDTKEIVAVCTITHRAGHSEPTERRFPLAMSDFMSPAQSFASAYTFASRYAFCGALGILTSDDDDDANSLDVPKPARPAEPPRHQTPPTVATPKPNGHADPNLPQNGAELLARLQAFDAKLAAAGTCKPGELLKHVAAQGENVCGYPADLGQWTGPAIQFAVDTVKAFIELRKQAAKPAAQAPAPDGVRFANVLREKGKQLHAEGGCANEDDLTEHLKAFGKSKGWGESIALWKGPELAEGDDEAGRWLQEKWEAVRAQSEPVEGEIVSA